MAVRAWLRMQEPDFYSYMIFLIWCQGSTNALVCSGIVSKNNNATIQ